MPLKVLDLFAGCGGCSTGLLQAGLEIVGAVEIDQWAADTYRKNHPDIPMIQADIRSLSNKFIIESFGGKVDLVVGGPPCQGFSVAGRRQYGEVSEKNTLVEEFVRVIGILKPKFVLMENVRGFSSGQLRPGNPVMDYVHRALQSFGYYTQAQVLQAADYGIPSLRSRIFIFGQLKHLEVNPFPAPTHSATPNLLRSPYLSVLDAISDLPVLEAGQGTENFTPYLCTPKSTYQMTMRNSAGGVTNHVAMKHTKRLVDRFRMLEPGEKAYDLGRRLSNNDEKVTIYKSNNQRLHGNLPSLCITANFQSSYVHPTQPRNLTAREAARLMSFPDSYIFCGKRTQMSASFLKKYGRENENNLSQYNQIGNAIPPLLAKAIGEKLIASQLARSAA